LSSTNFFNAPIFNKFGGFAIPIRGASSRGIQKENKDIMSFISTLNAVSSTAVKRPESFDNS